jgi:predicted enzyme related to lactoylglutathione lyase
MLKSTEIAFTGTPVTDMPRARAFYEGVLGFKPTMVSAGGMWIEYDFGNGTFAIGCYGEAWKPAADGTCIAFEVDNADEAVAQFKALGVPVHLDVTDTPICLFAIICDPDGNKIMLHQRKAKGGVSAH